MAKICRRIKEFVKKSPTRITAHTVPKLENPNLENIVFDWIMDQMRVELAVSTFYTINKAASIDFEFKGGDENK